MKQIVLDLPMPLARSVMGEVQSLLTETETVSAHGGCQTTRFDEGDPLPLVGDNIPELAVTHHTSNLKNRDRFAASGLYETMIDCLPEMREDLRTLKLDENGGCLIPYLIGPLLPIYNKSIESPPTSWEDLLDERWQGRITIADSNVHFNLLRANLGPIFGKKLEPFLDSLVYQGNPVNVNYEVDAGNADIGITALPFARSSRKGNISLCWPLEGALCIQQVLIIKKDAHKDALKVAKFLLSEKVQRLASDAGLIPVNPNVPLPDTVVESDLNLYWMGWDRFVQALNEN